MSTWQSRIRAAVLTRRLPLVAAIVAGLALALLGAGCAGGSTSASHTASPSATGKAGMLPDSQSKGDAPLLTPGTYKAELGGKLPGGGRDRVDWYKVRVGTGEGVINLLVTVPKGATYFEEILTPDGKTMNQGSFAGPQFGIEAPVAPGLFYIRLEAVQGSGRYTLVLTLN